jgi:hypothetical protein
LLLRGRWWIPTSGRRNRRGCARRGLLGLQRRQWPRRELLGLQLRQWARREGPGLRRLRLCSSNSLALARRRGLESTRRCSFKAVLFPRR